MNLEEIIAALNLTVLTTPGDFKSIQPQGGYASDLLSCVMAGAGRHSLWLTLQSHSNIVAVAALLDLAAIIITEGAMPDESTIAKANEEGITLLATNEKTFAVAGKLWEMGIREV